MKRDVFISYKSSSLPTVEKLAKLFENNDILCWYAPRNLNEDGLGKEFDDEIVDAIKNTSAVVVLLNDQALKSKWVKRELTQAEKYGKLILPFVIDELTVENGLSMRLEDKHMISAFPEPENKFPLLLNSVQHLLGKTDVSKITDSNESPYDNSKPERANGGSGAPDIYDLDYEEGIAFLEADEESDAFMAFLRSAERHNSKAYEQLFSIMFLNCKTTDFINEDTWEHIEDLSDEGEGFADLLMHYRYYAMGTQNDIALKYLKRALDKQVSPFAFLQMGICYGWGLGVSLSDVLSKHYYLKAYDAGCWEATRYLAQMYMYGNEKTPIDLAQSEKYAKEGAEKGVLRCYDMLFRLYNNHDRTEEALQLVQYMVDHHLKGGYCLMGDYYLFTKQENETAKKWYVQGTEHNDKQAWGKLSYLSWIADDTEEAFRLAQKGVHLNDSWSHWWLAYLYEQDGERQDLDKAWEYYMAQVYKFGVEADGPARLYLEKGYKPSENQLAELKHYLILDSLQQQCDSIKALLKIILIEHGQEPVIDYESLRHMPDDTLDYLRRGAEISQADNSELQYIYGRLLLEDSGKNHDPYQGNKMMLAAANKGHEPAIQYMFDHIKDRDMLGDLAASLIHTLKVMPEYLSPILRYGKGKVSDEDLSTWIQRAIDIEHKDTKWLQEALHAVSDKMEFTELRFKLYQAELNVYRKTGEEVPEEEIKRIQKDIYKNIYVLRASGCLSLLKDYIHILLPNYDPTPLYNGDLSDQEMFDLLLCQSKSYDRIGFHTKLPLEKTFFEILWNGLEKGEGLTDEVIGYKSLRSSYGNICEAFYTIQELFGADKVISPLDNMDFTSDDITPCCTIDTAIEHMRRTLMMLLASHEVFGDKWSSICSHWDNQDELLNLAEKLPDPNAQFLLVEFVEVYIDAIEVIVNANTLRTAIHKEDKQTLVKELNEHIAQLDKLGLKHHLQPFTEETLPSFEMQETPSNDSASKKEDIDEEFEKLLDDFLNSEAPSDK